MQGGYLLTAAEGTYAPWLATAQIVEKRLTPEQRGLLQAAFAFRQRCGDDYYSNRLLSHFLLHCSSGLKVAGIARLVGISRPTASHQQGVSSKEAIQAAHHRMAGRPHGKLLPRDAGPLAEFLLTQAEATRYDTLDFIERLCEIDQQCSADELGDVQKVALVQAIARRLNLSLRSVNRYLRILQTPMAVQAAYERGELSLTAAGKVALLLKGDQERVAQQIETGENATAVVEALLPTGPQDPREVQRTWERLVRYLADSVDLLNGRVGELPAPGVHAERETLLAAQLLLAALLQRGNEAA